MERINKFDLNKIIEYGGENIDKKKHKELTEIYKKLEFIGQKLKNKGFEYTIRKDPRKQAGPGKFVFRDYQWMKVFPKGYKKHCDDKFSYIIGLSDSLHFHMMGIKKYQNSPQSLSASKQSWTEIDIDADNSYERIVDEFIKFDKKYRQLFLKTGAELGIDYCIKKLKQMKIQEIKTILENKKQIILQGAPGTGKTYTSAEIALNIINNEVKNYASREELMSYYKKAVEEGYITFTTFHQSLDYEEFIEGIKPNTENGIISYEVEDGLFKKICNKAKVKNENNFELAYNMLINEIKKAENEILILKTKTGKSFGISINRNGNLNLHTGKELTKQGVLTKDNILKQLSGINTFEGWESYFWGVINHLKENHNFKENTSNKKQNYILIIDEINRGNISKIFGELITLLENDKRLGEENEINLKLPYSGEEFGVPSNLYIIGTMNTADRSIGHIDYAVRRRFAFVTLKAEKEKVSNYYISKGLDENLKQKAENLFDVVYNIVEKNIAPDFAENDLMIGHSYFMAENEDELRLKLEYEIKPLLYEYVKDGILFMSKENEKTIENITIQ